MSWIWPDTSSERGAMAACRRGFWFFLLMGPLYLVFGLFAALVKGPLVVAGLVAGMLVGALVALGIALGIRLRRRAAAVLALLLTAGSFLRGLRMLFEASQTDFRPYWVWVAVGLFSSALSAVAFHFALISFRGLRALRGLIPEQRKPESRLALVLWTSLGTLYLGFCLLLLVGAVRAFVIPTGAMQDTLLIGDHLLVENLSYAPIGAFSKHVLPYGPVKHGDVIVFRYPVDIKQTFVKRVIGLPGDRIRVESKQVYRNGVKLNEPYVYHKTDYPDSYRDNFPGLPNLPLPKQGQEMLEKNVVDGELVVPPNHYFAMGDNRDSSWDCRYWGFVPRENIIGKPLIIYWSYDTTTERLASPTIGLDHLMDLAQNFFAKTRWRRTFKLVRAHAGR